VAASSNTSLITEEELPGHLKMSEEEEVGFMSEAEDHKLSDPVNMFNRSSFQNLGKVFPVISGFLVKYLDFFDSFSGHLMEELEADSFNFRQFWHTECIV
jgi:hypothetical protein